MEYDLQQLTILAEIELQRNSLEFSDEDLKEAYREFAELYPILNTLCLEHIEEAEKLSEIEIRRRANSIDRVGIYGLIGLFISIPMGNIPGVLVSSASLYAWFITPRK